MLDWQHRHAERHPDGIRNHTGGQYRGSAGWPPAAMTGL
jgi:hypothetical protein